MLKTIAFIGFAAAVALPSVPAFAVSGNSSSYGTQGWRPHRPDAVADDRFRRSYNHANESKDRA